MPNLDALARELNALLHTETRSLLQHVETEAQPYYSPDDYRLWKMLRNMRHLNDEHARRISALLTELELPERPGPFDVSVAGFHYVDLRTLLPKLVDEKRRQVARYERALEAAKDWRQVTVELAALLTENREQLGQLSAHLRGQRGQMAGA
jgi:hypothetical protein